MNRAHLFRIHKYVGLAMAALLLVQALTGALLLYRGPAARWIDPAGMVGHGRSAAISAGSVVVRAEGALPSFHVVRLFAPDADQGVWLAELDNDSGAVRFASIDPADGKLLRTGPLWRFPVEAALQLHYRLMAGKAGMTIILLNALAVLTMAVTGLIYWWPRRGPVSRHLSIRSDMAARLILRQAHRTLGVVMSALLGFMAVTGLLLIVPELIETTSPTLRRTTASPAAIDRGLALAQTAFPQSPLRDIRIGADRLTVNFHALERNPRAVHRAVLAIDAPRIINATRAENNRALWMTVLPLHTGNRFGATGPIVVMIAALALLALSFTGPIMWWQARSLRRRSINNRQTA